VRDAKENCERKMAARNPGSEERGAFLNVQKQTNKQKKKKRSKNVPQRVKKTAENIHKGSCSIRLLINYFSKAIRLPSEKRN